MGRRAILHPSEMMQKTLPQVGKQSHVNTRLATTHHRAQGNEQKYGTIMPIRIPATRIFLLRKQIRQFQHETLHP